MCGAVGHGSGVESVAARPQPLLAHTAAGYLVSDGDELAGGVLQCVRGDLPLKLAGYTIGARHRCLPEMNAESGVTPPPARAAR
jgi:hypothetical protein